MDSRRDTIYNMVSNNNNNNNNNNNIIISIIGESLDIIQLLEKIQT